MAPARSRLQVGSAQWILSEREHASKAVAEEVEDFSFSVRNELDWLNEHMRDILANQQLNITDVFKTPGKLRGKTPRTARTARKPLSDMFAPNPQAATSPTQALGIFSAQRSQFQVARDVSPSVVAEAPVEEAPVEEAPVEEAPVEEAPVEEAPVEEAPVAEASVEETPAEAPAEDDMEIDPADVIESTQVEQMDIDDAHTPSEASSPVKPLLRKSSLTFASLPAREPLATRVSRTSHLEQTKVQSQTRQDEPEAVKKHNITSSQQLHERITMLGHTKEPCPSKSASFSNPVSQAASQPAALAHDDEEDDWIPSIPAGNIAAAPATINEPVVIEKNNQEDEAQEDADDEVMEFPAPPKSPMRPGLHLKSASTTEISSPTKAQMAVTSSHTKSISVSNPTLAAMPSTTPVGSPVHKNFNHNPLSASKAKLYSVLKSAKGIFASSAGVSASAKLEALSPAPSRTAKQTTQQMQQGSWEELLSPHREVQEEAELYPNIEPAVAEAARSASPSKPAEVRKTRSSTEREKKEKEQQSRVADNLEKAREKERQKAAAFQLKRNQSKEDVNQLRSGASSRAETIASQEVANSSSDDMPPPPPKSLLPTAQAPKPKETRRIVKPTKEPVKTKPAPMNIKVGLASQRLQPTTSALSASLQDSLPPPPPARASTRATQANGAVASSFKASVTAQSARPKALEAAAKKKEQEEKAAARKAEQKRELERKRAEKLEQEKQAEQQRKAAEQQRVQEAKKAAQRQAAEAKKLEQERKEAQRALKRPANDLTHAMLNEKSQPVQAHPRGDLGAARPISRMNMVQEQSSRAAPQMNPAGPAKRARPNETAEEQHRPALQRNGPSYQQLDANKRRKTIDDEEEDQENYNAPMRQSIKAPPMRPSNQHKVTDYSATLAGLLKANNQSKPSVFSHGYTSAASAASSQTSIHKSTVTSQHLIQHHKAGGHPNDLAQVNNAKIPFAQNPNPPATAANAHKTPARPFFPGASIASAMKSPSQFTPGSEITLPEIATDSEDEDEDQYDRNGKKKKPFKQPAWADSPNLRDLLAAQQLVDPVSVFGPIAPLNMEEVFTDRSRHKRFRDRTSSANWAGSDRLTEEDRKKDREGRERLMRDGAWTYGTGF